MAEQLKQMHTPHQELDSLIDRAGDYLDTRLDLMRLKAISTTSDIVSSISAKTVVAMFVIVFLIAINMGLALLIGEWLGKAYYGFFIMALINLIAGLIFLKAGSRWVKAIAAEKLIKKFFKG